MVNNLPNSWDSITLSQWLEWIEIQNDSSVVSKDLEILAFFYNITLEDSYFDQDFNIIINDLKSLYWSRIPHKAQSWTVWDKWQPLQLNNLTLGEFIDIEHYINDFNNWGIATAILTRQTKVDEWGEIMFEPYKYQPTERANVFLEMPIPYVQWVIDNYSRWRSDFIEKYSLLFHQKEDGIDTEDDEMVGRERIDAKVAQKKQAIAIKWSWERLLWDLTDGDITKMESLLMTPVILVFNILAMRQSIGN
jgi:hypothetical protein